MSREEAKKIIMVIVSVYPNWKPNDLNMTVDSWHFMLSDYSYQQISVALKTYISTSGSAFAPSVSELIGILDKPNELNVLTDAEAWAMVRHILTNSIYNSVENFNSLPDTVQKAVGSAEQLRLWAMTDEETVDTVIASNFKRSYRTQTEKEKQLRLMPPEMKALAEQTAKRLTDNAH